MKRNIEWESGWDGSRLHAVVWYGPVDSKWVKEKYRCGTERYIKMHRVKDATVKCGRCERLLGKDAAGRSGLVDG